MRLLRPACLASLVVSSFLVCLGPAQEARAGFLTVGDYPGPNEVVSFTGLYDHLTGHGGDWVGSYDGNTLSYLYCVDLFRDIQPPSTYNTTTVSQDGTIFGAPTPHAGQIAWMLDHYGASSQQVSPADSAGLQSAIWKIEYPDQFTLDGATDPAVMPAYQKYLQLFADAGSPSAPVSDILWFSPSGQDYPPQQGLAGGAVLAAPEPATWILAGLGGVLAFRRRRRRR